MARTRGHQPGLRLSGPRPSRPDPVVLCRWRTYRRGRDSTGTSQDRAEAGARRSRADAAVDVPGFVHSPGQGLAAAACRAGSDMSAGRRPWLSCLCRLSAGVCRDQLAGAGVLFPALRNWPAYWPPGAGELRAGQVGAGEVRVGEVGAGEVRAGEVRAGEPGATEVRAGEVRADEFRGAEIRAGEDRMGEDCFGEFRAGEVRAIEIRAGEPGAAEIGAGEVRAGEVNRPDVALGKPAPDRGKGGLNVGSHRSFPGPAAGTWWRPLLV